MLFKLPIQLLLAATSGLASPLVARDDVQSLDAAVPNSVAGQLYALFQPYIKAVDTCKPYPAVSADGKVYFNKKHQDCADSPKGQIYVRSLGLTEATKTYHGLLPIMYTWYFPSSAQKNSIKNDWQQTIVWLTVQNSGQTVQDYSIHHLSLSSPAGYVSHYSFKTSDVNRPLVQYQPFVKPVAGFGLALSADAGEQQPAIAWEMFTPEAKAGACNEKFFDSKIAPFCDAQFSKHLDAAIMED